MLAQPPLPPPWLAEALPLHPGPFQGCSEPYWAAPALLVRARLVPPAATTNGSDAGKPTLKVLQSWVAPWSPVATAMLHPFAAMSLITSVKSLIMLALLTDPSSLPKLELALRALSSLSAWFQASRRSLSFVFPPS